MDSTQAKIRDPMDIAPRIFEEPVFVLCSGRSGSTLLRFVLDTHPDLACPPETSLPALCAQLATVWSLIEGAPLSGERGDEPPDIPDTAIKGIRRTMDEMIGSYLARRGKRRYCDKSLGAARFAELLLRVYPQVKFLCLYRHPMDVIASGLEACPWGLNGYGFEPYIAGTPGNSVLALARFWADNAATILQAEERFPNACHRVKYEDLVGSPQDVADGIFTFLGVRSLPAIAARCFSPDRERFGPADHKIWHTTQITTSSVGRGWDIPAGLIAPPVLEQVNQLADKLGYTRVDAAWGTGGRPAALRMPPHQSADPSVRNVHALIGERLRAGVSRSRSRFARRWSQCSDESFDAVALFSGQDSGQMRWRVDLAVGTVKTVADDDASTWDIVGSTTAWGGVLSGAVNLSVALRRCELRYCDGTGAGSVAADTRIGMLADLLGLTSWDRSAQAWELGEEAEAACTL